MQVGVSSCALIEGFLNVTLSGLLRATRIAACLMVSSVFPKHSCFPRSVPGINVKTDALGSKTTSKSLISKGSFWIGSHNIWFATVFEPVMQQCIQHNFTGHIAQSMFRLLKLSRRRCDFQHAGSTQGASNRTDLLEDKCPVYVEPEQQLDVTCVSDFLHKSCS